MNINTLLNSVIIRYLSIRYLTYFLQFINSILLLHYLSSFDFGVYSFVLLLLSYYSYSNIGLNASLNTLLSIYKNRELLIKKIWYVALTLNIAIIVIIGSIVIIVNIVFPNLFTKYDYHAIAYKVFAIGILVNTNLLFVSLYRVFGIFHKINIQQILPQFALFLVILLLRKNVNIDTIVSVLVFSNMVVLVIMINKMPLPLKLGNNKVIAQTLLIRGFNLMLYNFSFRFITIAATTIVSIFYLSSELGYYSFANTFSNAIVMITGSLMFILYPKILNQFASINQEKSIELIKKIRVLYITAVDLIGLSSILIIPIIASYSDKYSPIIETYKILIAAQLILNNTSGYLQFLIAKKQERVLILYAIYGISSVFLIGLLVAWANLTFHLITIGVLVGVSTYTFFVINHSNKVLNKKNNVSEILKTIFSFPKLSITIILILSYLLNENYILPPLAVLFYIFINKKHIISLVHKTTAILRDNNFVNF
ncbi:hypothetical protein CLV93_110126 [Prolixibacter denitrificans]|uniref:O-antigen/teichoic acid export membrane protein n=1 Tax=Prolixibacter denitrificans TaxID=1541063 RepID=A0A2P8C8Q2_9BACT|nr:hypothetical protein CLV93_110126 [Prolixibacter denitrificans]